jgi:4,5-dihydroxyphthalate decarboxylase
MNARDQSQPVIERETEQGLLPVHLAMADYDRTRPIFDGRVKPKGVQLKLESSWIGDFCIQPIYEKYDVAEFSLSWYLAAKARKEPCIALPLFPLRMPVLAYLFVRDDSDISSPRDLIGKRIACPGYRYTVNLWVRGLLKEHYGLSPEQVNWISCTADEGAGYKIPKGVPYEQRPGEDPEKLVLEGKADALLVPTAPKSIIKMQGGLRRLFRDARGEHRSLVARTGILPITHTVVMKQELYEKNKWLAKSIYDAFVEAQRQTDEFYDSDTKRLCLSEALFAMEEERAIYGPNAWSQGLNETNRKVIETFVRYAYDQQYIDRILPLEELFAPV